MLVGHYGLAHLCAQGLNVAGRGGQGQGYGGRFRADGREYESVPCEVHYTVIRCCQIIPSESGFSAVRAYYTLRGDVRDLVAGVCRYREGYVGKYGRQAVHEAAAVCFPYLQADSGSGYLSLQIYRHHLSGGVGGGSRLVQAADNKVIVVSGVRGTGGYAVQRGFRVGDYLVSTAALSKVGEEHVLGRLGHQVGECACIGGAGCDGYAVEVRVAQIVGVGVDHVIVQVHQFRPYADAVSGCGDGELVAVLRNLAGRSVRTAGKCKCGCREY